MRPVPATGPQDSPVAAGPAPVLGLHEAIMLIVGVVIGAGIFKAPALVAQMTASPGWMFGAWLLGGAVSLVGALCYAELTTSYAHPGGDYHFLQRAYGRSVSFLFGWARFSVITTGSIALLAFVFGDYMNQALPLPPVAGVSGSAIYAVLAVVMLAWLNLRGIRTGASTQSWLTGLEVAGLLLIVAAGLLLFVVEGAPPAATTTVADPPATAGAFGLAMVFVLLTYGGWNEAAYISAEVHNRSRNMVRALIASVLIITTLYMLVTWAYWQALGQAGMARSEALAADLMGKALGPTGELVIAVMVAMGALTSINATMIVGSRTNYAMGRDWPALQRLALWDRARGTPVFAMQVQTAAALLLVVLGTWTGSGFKAIVEFTAPVFWLFFLMSGVALFVLRHREPGVERPFKVPLYPLLPLVFCATCAYMLWSSLSYVYSQSLGGFNAAWIGVAVLSVGLLLLFVVGRTPGRAAAMCSTPPQESP